MNGLLARFAATLIDGGGDVGIPTLEADQVFSNGLNLVYTLAGIIAVIVIIIAGIMYSTSAGDPGRITKAKNLILYAVIGLVVVIIAFAVTNFVSGRFA
jgi:hypothetical protein